MTYKTASETIFEQFCTDHSVHWEPIPTEDSAGLKTPDYFIYPAGNMIAVEVKEIRANAEEREQHRQLEGRGWSTFGCKIGDRARHIISTGSKQLRAKAKGRCPAMILIHNPDVLLRHHTEPQAIKAAMHGFDTFVLGLSSDMRQRPVLIDRKSGPARKMTPEHNTSISAVAVLDSNGLTVYHNIYAEHPVSLELFKGIAVQFTLGGKRPGEFVEWQEIG